MLEDKRAMDLEEDREVGIEVGMTLVDTHRAMENVSPGVSLKIGPLI